MKIKATVISFLISTCVSLTANALPDATFLQSVTPTEIVSVPGYHGDINLVAAIEYGNSCVAGLENVYSHQTGKSVTIYTATDSEAFCISLYEPIIKWTTVAYDLQAGDSVSINSGEPLTVEEPQIKACILTVCEDGSQRDNYTCACANGYTN